MREKSVYRKKKETERFEGLFVFHFFFSSISPTSHK